MSGATSEVTAYLGVGANQGDRLAQCREALERLAAWPGICVMACSAWYQTAPVGPVVQNSFINGVVALRVRLSAVALLAACLEIEQVMGRQRTVRWGPRLIDLDVLLYGDAVIDRDGLTVPHPEMTRRGFVMTPLAELAPDLVIPGTDGSVAQLAQALALENGSIEPLPNP